jgi:hypothetical protein
VVDQVDERHEVAGRGLGLAVAEEAKVAAANLQQQQRLFCVSSDWPGGGGLWQARQRGEDCGEAGGRRHRRRGSSTTAAAPATLAWNSSESGGGSSRLYFTRRAHPPAQFPPPVSPTGAPPLTRLATYLNVSKLTFSSGTTSVKGL